jgi:cyclase
MSRFFALSAAGLAGLLAWSQLPPPEPLKLIPVTEGVHILEGAGGNVAVVTTSEGTILIDDKFAPNVPQIYEAAKKLSDRPIRYLLNTHHHGDHTGGNAGLAAKEPMEILAHTNARANMIKGAMPGVPRIGYRDSITIGLGGVELQAIHLGRAHTNGDAVIFFPQKRLIHTGDLFAAPGPFIDYANGGSGVEWVATLDKVLALDFDKVIPGHGPVSTKADLKAYRDKIDAMVRKMTELKRKGLSKEDAVKAFDPASLGWEPGRMFNRTLPPLYDEVAR